MTEIQAAIGRIALTRLPAWVESRRRNAAQLIDACREFPCLRIPMPPDDMRHSYYKFYMFVRPEQLAIGWSRNRILQELRDAGVPCFSGSCSEIYLEDAFPPDWKPAQDLAVARELGETSLMFLVHPTLSAAEIEQVCQAVRKVIRQATRDDRDASPSLRKSA